MECASCGDRGPRSRSAPLRGFSRVADGVSAPGDRSRRSYETMLGRPRYASGEAPMIHAAEQPKLDASINPFRAGAARHACAPVRSALAEVLGQIER
jgi:hypothetical protein